MFTVKTSQILLIVIKFWRSTQQNIHIYIYIYIFKNKNIQHFYCFKIINLFFFAPIEIITIKSNTANQNPRRFT